MAALNAAGGAKGAADKAAAGGGGHDVTGTERQIDKLVTTGGQR